MRRMSNSVAPGCASRFWVTGRMASPDDDQIPLEHQLIEGDRHRALDGILQGHEAEVDVSFRDGGQDVHEGGQRPQMGPGQPGFAAKGLLGKGAGRSQEPDSGLWGDGAGHGRAG